MKQSIVLLLNFLFIILAVQGQTPAEKSRAAYMEYQKADKELNHLCQQAIKAKSTDTLFVRNFKVAQKIWVQLRDAELRMQYPEKDKGYTGTIQPECWSLLLAELTKERTAKINTLVAGGKLSPCAVGGKKE